MKVEWNVDPVMNRTLWEKLSGLPKQLIGARNPRTVLDLGGGTGDFALPLMEEGTTVISLDTDLDVLRHRVSGVQAILGDATSLPFKDSSIDAITARAILHHFPEGLQRCLMEVNRVLGSRGLLLAQEPLANNIFANIARKYVQTERHETGERPLDPDHLENAIGRIFDVKWKEHHFLISYLYPHIVHRLPGPLKSLGRLDGRIAKSLDEKALDTMPGLRKYAAYMTILGEKRSP